MNRKGKLGQKAVMVTIGVRVPREIRDRLRALAEREGARLTDAVRDVLGRGLASAEREQKKRLGE